MNPRAPQLAIVVAMAENRVIGRNGDLPWRLPDDWKHFKQLTSGHTVIMGRKTFESLPHGPLPERRNLVVTRQPDYTADGATITHSLDEAIELARVEDDRAREDSKRARSSPTERARSSPTRAYLIGGAQLYTEALQRDLVETIHLTRVHAHPEGDVWFPRFDADAWALVERTAHPADDRHAHAFTFERYERKRG